MISLECNGNTCLVRVIKQAVGNNYMKAMCNCKGRGIDNVASCPMPDEQSDSDTDKEDGVDVEGEKDISHEVADKGCGKHQRLKKFA